MVFHMVIICNIHKFFSFENILFITAVSVYIDTVYVDPPTALSPSGAVLLHH